VELKELQLLFLTEKKDGNIIQINDIFPINDCFIYIDGPESSDKEEIQKILKRAEGLQGRTLIYQLLSYNCQHFAISIRFGMDFSPDLDSLGSALLDGLMEFLKLFSNLFFLKSQSSSSYEVCFAILICILKGCLKAISSYLHKNTQRKYLPNHNKKI